MSNSSPSLDDTSSGLAGRLAVVFIAGVGAQVVGSAFNIWYNLSHIRPLLTPAQDIVFVDAIESFNLAAYPLLAGIWGWVVFSLGRRRNPERRREKARRRVINLPWWVTGIAAAGWLPCVPVLLLALLSGDDPVNEHIFLHLPVSILLAGMIAMTHAFFAVDLLSGRLLYPYFFKDASPAAVRGGFPLPITGRGILWAISAGVCPILALLLLLLSPSEAGRANPWFAVAVAVLGILFCLTSSLLLGKLVVEPVDALREAAERVGRGETDIKIDLLRADEFGVLVNAFNGMVVGLREKEYIRQTFGQHVGQAVAERLLEQERDLGGVEQVVSVLFGDIRGFTTRCELLEPHESVALLNRFHAMAAEAVEENGGIVNQIIGDGLMCLFGVTEDSNNAADAAIAAGYALFAGLNRLNHSLADDGYEPLRIGVGIHTGPAVVGTMGSPRRLIFSAIGDTVNTASRIEGLTKTVGERFLISEATFLASCQKPDDARRLADLEIRGRRRAVTLYALGSGD